MATANPSEKPTFPFEGREAERLARARETLLQIAEAWSPQFAAHPFLRKRIVIEGIVADAKEISHYAATLVCARELLGFISLSHVPLFQVHFAGMNKLNPSIVAYPYAEMARYPFLHRHLALNLAGLARAIGGEATIYDGRP